MCSLLGIGRAAHDLIALGLKRITLLVKCSHDRIRSIPKVRTSEALKAETQTRADRPMRELLTFTENMRSVDCA